MDQKEINDLEWKNPNNWSRIFGYYFSKQDDRIWVPKQNTWQGKSLNLANPYGKIIGSIFILIPIIVIGIVIWMMTYIK